MIPGRSARRDAVIVAALLGLVTATRVFVHFDPIRVKLVEAPIADRKGVVHVGADTATLHGLQPPFAVIARVHHSGPQPQPLAIRINGHDVCTVRVAEGSSQRKDCVFAAEWGQTDWHEWQFESPSPWTLDYLEVATHHGSSTGVLSAFVLPAASNRYTRPGVIWAIVFAAIWGGLLWVRDRWLRSVALARAQHALDLVVPGVAALILIAPLVSPYRVVLWAGTMVAPALLLLMPLARPLAVGIRRVVSER